MDYRHRVNEVATKKVIIAPHRLGVPLILYSMSNVFLLRRGKETEWWTDSPARMYDTGAGRNCITIHERRVHLTQAYHPPAYSRKVFKSPKRLKNIKL
jgi:hypothetical protein